MAYFLAVLIEESTSMVQAVFTTAHL